MAQSPVSAAVSAEQAYANYVAEVLYAAQSGSVAAIPNALATSGLDTAFLTDPSQIRAYRQSIADQINAQSGSGVTLNDLADRIADIQVTTVAQGADTLQVTVIDPMFVLGTLGVIQTDATGYLWPPIDVNFPSDTDCFWRIVQCNVTSDLSQPNVTLTFEDRIASLLRQSSPADKSMPLVGQRGQTLGGFIKMLVDATNAKFRHQPKIRLVEMISPADPNYTLPITVPRSAESGLRRNPNKTQQGVTSAQQATIDAYDSVIATVVAAVGPNNSASISTVEGAIQTGLGSHPGLPYGVGGAQGPTGPAPSSPVNGVTGSTHA